MIRNRFIREGWTAVNTDRPNENFNDKRSKENSSKINNLQIKNMNLATKQEAIDTNKGMEKPRRKALSKQDLKKAKKLEQKDAKELNLKRRQEQIDGEKQERREKHELKAKDKEEQRSKYELNKSQELKAKQDPKEKIGRKTLEIESDEKTKINLSKTHVQPQMTSALPQVTITAPINNTDNNNNNNNDNVDNNDNDTKDAEDVNDDNDANNNDDHGNHQHGNESEDVKESSSQPCTAALRAGNSNLALRRAVPDITITCPPIEFFDNLDEQCFTQRRYMVCRESPRSGKKRTSIVDFPTGLSSFDAEVPDSPRSFIDSPIPYSRIDLSFTFKGSLNSPFTPPMSPAFSNRKAPLNPGPFPVFNLEESFPTAEL
eukprot:gene6905-7683_t